MRWSFPRRPREPAAVPERPPMPHSWREYLVLDAVERGVLSRLKSTCDRFAYNCFANRVHVPSRGYSVPAGAPNGPYPAREGAAAEFAAGGLFRLLTAYRSILFTACGAQCGWRLLVTPYEEQAGKYRVELSKYTLSAGVACKWARRWGQRRVYDWARGSVRTVQQLRQSQREERTAPRRPHPAPAKPRYRRDGLDPIRPANAGRRRTE